MPRKYTEPQRRLLERLRQGWTAIVYAREHYCDLLPPPGLSLVALPGVARTVHCMPSTPGGSCGYANRPRTTPSTRCLPEPGREGGRRGVPGDL
jgi:hypothetical protein